MTMGMEWKEDEVKSKSVCYAIDWIDWTRNISIDSPLLHRVKPPFPKEEEEVNPQPREKTAERRDGCHAMRLCDWHDIENGWNGIENG